MGSKKAEDGGVGSGETTLLVTVWERSDDALFCDCVMSPEAAAEEGGVAMDVATSPP